MSPSEVASLLRAFVNAVPGVRGVNNHQGSQSTADPALMNELMRVLHDRHLFYIDSRTTAATVAYDAARQAGVRSAFRNVPFLDDVAEIPAVQKQLRLAVRGAKEKGEAIAIGHPHRATLMALQEVLPQAKAEGIQLVFASDLGHYALVSPLLICSVTTSGVDTAGKGVSLGRPGNSRSKTKK